VDVVGGPPGSIELRFEVFGAGQWELPRRAVMALGADGDVYWLGGLEQAVAATRVGRGLDMRAAAQTDSGTHGAERSIDPPKPIEANGVSSAVMGFADPLADPVQLPLPKQTPNPNSVELKKR
jgi:hypothetical protein